MTDSSNPYSAPTAEIQQPVAAAGTGELATRGQRFSAAVIDGLLMMVIFGPIMWFSGYIRRAQEAAMAGRTFFVEPILYSIVGLIIFAAIQWKPLSDTAQTWGKRFVGIKIVDATNGSKPTAQHIVVKRYLPWQLVSAVPKVGPLLGLVNILFIFSADRRCLHDRIANTRVVKA
jgi:uncharacterized RDD family membrane protein YckC